MRIEIDTREAILLTGILGTTCGQGLLEVYKQLMDILDKDEKMVADIMSTEIVEILKASGINEDDFLKEAVKQFEEGWLA